MSVPKFVKQSVYEHKYSTQWTWPLRWGNLQLTFRYTQYWFIKIHLLCATAIEMGAGLCVNGLCHTTSWHTEIGFFEWQLQLLAYNLRYRCQNVLWFFCGIFMGAPLHPTLSPIDTDFLRNLGRQIYRNNIIACNFIHVSLSNPSKVSYKLKLLYD